ncbi:MAG: saccharopine dehydrogenase NADP-binding domain-containing protein [Proteobacteria bacterium]|nr:saccharopine dehydrogenase NADP-binding domain-containing protein [Pseudomonadota bacterium]
MNRKSVLILGGYGRVGAATTRELMAMTDAPLTVAGRNKKKADIFARTLGHRVQGAYVDVFDKQSLLSAMANAVLTLNCAGPSSEINHIVAEAALESGCHYVDVACYEEATGKIQSWNQTVCSKELIFCTSAGLVPGLIGIIPGYLAGRLESVDAMDICFIFHDELTAVSAWDTVDQFKKGDLSIYKQGTWQSVPLYTIKKIVFPKPFGAKLCIPGMVYDMTSIPSRYAMNDFAFYGALQSELMSFIAVFCWLFRKIRSEKLFKYASSALRYLSVISTRKGPRGYAIRAIAHGQINHKKLSLTYDLSHHDMYLGTAIAAAITVKMILDKDIYKSGVFYLNECINPETFMEYALKRGLLFNVQTHKEEGSTA